MYRNLLAVTILAAVGVLSACSSAPDYEHESPSVSEYGFRQSSNPNPTQYGQLPQRTESAGSTEHVRGFPAGHPLNPHGSEPETPSHHGPDETALPHTSMNY